MRNTSSTLFFLLCLLISFSLHAFPDEERASLDLVSSQATSLVLQDDRYLFLSAGEDISRVDTQNWLLTTDQVPDLADNTDEGGDDLTGTVAGLAIRGSSLFATQSDGDLLTIDLNDLTEDPETAEIISGALGPLAADTESGTEEDKLYLLDKTNNAVIVYDISAETKTNIALTDSGGTAVTPVSLVFVPFPTTASSSTTDKIFVTSNRGLVFVLLEGGVGISETIALSTGNKDLPAAAVTPDGNFLMVVNSTDESVHVINTSTQDEVDADTVSSGVNPISLADNAGLTGIAITEVEDPSDTYAYVTGSSGISVIDLNSGTSDFNQPTVLDFKDEGGSDDVEDPLTLSSAPGLIVASSVDEGYVYASTGDSNLSVISDNPFVTIGSTSLGTGTLTTGGSFTVTFQSDEAGTYSVRVGGDSSADGTEVASGTVDTADADVTTASISYSSSLFSEGTNRIFVFVTDADGNLGRDAVDITVDTPPPEIEIVKTGFGNESIYVTFTRLSPSDIDHYNVYVDTDAATVAAKSAVSETVSQPDGGTSLEAKVEGLDNGTTYFIAVEAVDDAGNVGVRSTTLTTGGAATATPERTVGLAEAAGESGCSLILDEPANCTDVLWLGIGWFILIGSRLAFRFKKETPLTKGRILLFICLVIFCPLSLYAKELTPQWWSLEFKGGAWMPLNGTTKDFLGSCCEPMGAVEFGFLYKSKLGVEVGTGYTGAGGTAVGAASGTVSRDRFGFTMIPIQNSVAFRADFLEDQWVVPYVKTGLDYLIFRENTRGSVTTGFKLGVHAAGGVQILLDKIDELTVLLERSLGVNDIYWTLEGRYAWIDSFGGGGVDLSNMTFSTGFLFEF